MSRGGSGNRASRASGTSRVGGTSRASGSGPASRTSGSGPASRTSRTSRTSPASGTGPTSLAPAVTARPKLTSRAAVLAIVLCAIALTLAYPVREYIADRRQIDQLATANAQLAAEVKHMRAEARSLNSPAVIAREARDNLHMCFPSQTCYEVILPTKPHGRSAVKPTGSPWYGRLWESVRRADGKSTR